MRVVNLIDTSVFAALIAVPGYDQEHDEIRREFERRIDEGVTFVLPVTTIIETGNHIANAHGDRRSAAKRFIAALELARASSPPWTIRDVAWDDRFLASFIGGDSTGSDLLAHLTAGSMGAGDLAILVERDEFRRSVATADVRVWTLDAHLSAHGS